MVNFIHSMTCVNIITEKLYYIPGLNINHNIYQKDKNIFLPSLFIVLFYFIFYFFISKFVNEC